MRLWGETERLAALRCYALDMDGTIYLGENWIPGALRFIETARAKGYRVLFLTNNSSKSPQVYVERLHKMGCPVEERDILTSGQATTAYLNRVYPGKSVFLLGNDMLRAEFAADGIALCDDDSADIAIAAFDTTLDYRKMTIICDMVRAGKPYIATHPDFNCPTATGFIPDCGAIIAFIEASAGRRPDLIIGKPHGEIVEALLERTGLPREAIAMVGDRLYTDIATGENHGLCSILVLSGETKESDLAGSAVQPRIVADRLEGLVDWL